MKKEQFKLYADIKSQIKDLEKQASEIKTELEKEMEEAEADEVKTEFGTFAYVQKTSYEYTDTVKGLESQLRQVKKEEEKKGFAKPKISKYLRYIENK